MWIYPLARRQAGLDISLTKETKNTGTDAKKDWHAGKKYWHRSKKILARRHDGLEATEATSATL